MIDLAAAYTETHDHLVDVVRGLPGLRVRYGEKERVLGAEPVGATLTVDRFDLVRALTGRRSSAQIRAFDWDGDAETYVPLIPAYGERSDDSVE
jgi:hypothetical protein